MAANINLKAIIEKEKQDLTKHLIFIKMDYTKTDEQLKNIAEGLKEIDSESNAFLSMRTNTENREIRSFVVGKSKVITRMIAITMIENKEFRHVIFKALAQYAQLSSHTAEDCMKCKEPDCKGRKANYKGE